MEKEISEDFAKLLKQSHLERVPTSTIPALKKLGIAHYQIWGEWTKWGRKKKGQGLVHELTEAERTAIKEYAQKKHAEKNRAKRPPKKELAKLAEAIYVISKVAKKHRDRASQIYDAEIGENDEYQDYFDDYDRHQRKRRSRTFEKIRKENEEKNKWYEDKNFYLSAVVADYGIVATGFHTFGDEGNRDYYEFCGFGFHADSHNSEKFLGEIDESISAEAEKSKMTVGRAVNLLSFFYPRAEK